MSAYAVLLRIARRDAARAKGRSALIALMIGLPIFGLSAGDVLARTAQADPDEQAARRLGQAAYVLRTVAPPGSHLMQAVDPDKGSSWSGDGGQLADPRSAVPKGARSLVEQGARVSVKTATGQGDVDWTEVAAGDQEMRGRYVVSGRAARSPGEVLVTPGLLSRTGLRVGGALRILEPAKTVTIVGTVRQTGSRRDSQAALAFPGTLIGAPGGLDAGAVDHTDVFVTGVAPLTWSQVLALNDRGIVAYDRHLVQHPPPRSEVPYYRNFSGGSGPNLAILAAAAVVGLGGLEVVLLAGAALAVGAKRQSRSLALLAASGGNSRHLRLVVLSGGLVLGVVAGVSGVLLGIAAAAVGRPVISRVTEQSFARFDVRPLELAAIALLGAITGLVAAVVPARGAARLDVMAALRGRRGTVRTGLRVPVAGVVVTALGVAMAAAGSLWAAAQKPGPNAGVSVRESYLVAGAITGGAALAVLGLVILSPALIGGIGHLARWLPLAPRLAVRDAARHRGRSAPAMAAVLAAVSSSASLLLYVASSDDHDRRNYQPQLPPNTASVQLQYYPNNTSGQAPKPSYAAPEPVVSAARASLPVRSSTVLRRTTDCYSEPALRCPGVQLSAPQANLCPESLTSGRLTEKQRERAAAIDWRCENLVGSQSRSAVEQLTDRIGYLVGDAALVERLTGVNSAGIRSTLDAGGAVTFDRADIDHGALDFDVFAPGAGTGGPPPGQEDTWTGPKPTSRIRVPAMYVQVDGTRSGVILSPQAAKRLGQPVNDAAVLLDLTRLPRQSEQDAATSALQTSTKGRAGSVYVERGYTSSIGLGLLALVLGAGVVTLGAAGVATGLAQADARADFATLASVGACQALTIAVLGTALGVAVGFVPAVAVIGAVGSLELVVPWTSLAGVLVGVPLLAAVGAFLCTRSRLPLERRMAA